MEKTNGQIWVSSQFCKSGKPVGDEITKENMILVDTFETTPAEVEAKMGLTINLGNYESLRVDVGVKMPCYKEEIEKAKALAFQLVEKELFAKVREVKGSL